MSVEYNPNRLGWPAAAVTVVGTLALLFMAYTIHDRTYRHPRDPMNQQVYHARDIAGGGEHGPAEHGAPAAAEQGATPPADAKSGGH